MSGASRWLEASAVSVTKAPASKAVENFNLFIGFFLVFGLSVIYLVWIKFYLIYAAQLGMDAGENVFFERLEELGLLSQRATMAPSQTPLPAYHVSGQAVSEMLSQERR